MIELPELKLALYGGGKMGMAMLMGWVANGVAPNQIAVFDPAPSDELKQTGVILNPDGFDTDVIVLAVKPQIMPDLMETTEFSDTALVISVAAGCPIAQFQTRFGSQRPIIRAMPNTPAAIGAGITAIIGNEATNAQLLDLAEKLLQSIGQVIRLENENQMDAVTGLSGSGPAYVFYMMECMRAAGIQQGLPENISHQLALNTIAGAGQLALQTGTDPSVLRENVTSPGGTTAAGLSVLMNDEMGLNPLIGATIAAAADRSRELGK